MDTRRLQDVDTDSDDESLTSLSPFSAPQNMSGTRTSYDSSMRPASPVPSVWSITSSIRAQAFKEEHGRQLNNCSEVYRLPADKEELDRLNKQHDMFLDVMGKYPPGLAEVMQDDVPGETKAALDLGYGSGAWIVELAREYPQSIAVAVDLVPSQALIMPDNCRTEVDDINLGLEHFYGDFNVVHARLISSGIKNYVHLIDQMSRVLRPAGLLDIMEFDFHVYDPMPDGNHRRIDVETSMMADPWVANWMVFASLAAKNAGGDPDAATHLHRWIFSHAALDNIVYKDYWVPVSPHASFSEYEKKIGTRMRDNILAFLKSGRPLLLGSGVPELIVNELQINAERELRMAIYPQYLRFQRVYCRKRTY
ncbi:hypothetical protein C8R43DRAFT_876010 [Mycena crocata]|nr:hypothetical protein C8R43DRAFT_876010 [Mycena crocata]